MVIELYLNKDQMNALDIIMDPHGEASKPFTALDYRQKIMEIIEAATSNAERY